MYKEAQQHRVTCVWATFFLLSAAFTLGLQIYMQYWRMKGRKASDKKVYIGLNLGHMPAEATREEAFNNNPEEGKEEDAELDD